MCVCRRNTVIARGYRGRESRLTALQSEFLRGNSRCHSRSCTRSREVPIRGILFSRLAKGTPGVLPYEIPNTNRVFAGRGGLRTGRRARYNDKAAISPPLCLPIARHRSPSLGGYWIELRDNLLFIIRWDGPFRSSIPLVARRASLIAIYRSEAVPNARWNYRSSAPERWMKLFKKIYTCVKNIFKNINFTCESAYNFVCQYLYAYIYVL